MKRCRVCETEVENYISICPVCGNAFDKDDIIVETGSRKRSIVPIIIFSSILLMALIIGLTCFFVFSNSKARTADDEASNNSSEISVQTSISADETLRAQNTTIEIVINESYYIKYDKDKSYVNMYEKANEDSNVIKKIKSDGKSSVKVTVLKEDNSFYFVKYKGKKGYINKKYLTKSKQKSTSVTTATQQITQPIQGTTQRQTTYIRQADEVRRWRNLIAEEIE